MERRKIKEQMVSMYVSYLRSLVNGQFTDVSNYENDFLIKSAEAINNLNQSGYKVS